jgi:hypothetical protein
MGPVLNLAGLSDLNALRVWLELQVFRTTTVVPAGAGKLEQGRVKEE